MRIEDMSSAKFSELSEDQEFWQPARAGKTPQSMADLLGPYVVYETTGHVLNKLFELPRRLEDHELMRVGLNPARRELYLMQPSDVVYIAHPRAD